MLEKIKSLYHLIFYGCIWGLIELSLGGFLHFIHYPYTGGIMGAIAYTIMLIYFIHHKNIWHPIYIGIIAAAFKLFNVFIFGVPIFSRSIINPALAIIVEAISVSVGAFIIISTAKLLNTQKVKK